MSKIIPAKGIATKEVVFLALWLLSSVLFLIASISGIIDNMPMQRVVPLCVASVVMALLAVRAWLMLPKARR